MCGEGIKCEKREMRLQTEIMEIDDFMPGRFLRKLVDYLGNSDQLNTGSPPHLLFRGGRVGRDSFTNRTFGDLT